MRLGACIGAIALAVGVGEPAATWVAAPARFAFAADPDSAGPEPRLPSDIPVPPRSSSTRGASLADLITSLRAQGPIPPSENDALLREEIVRGTLALQTPPPIPSAVKTRYERALRAASRKAKPASEPATLRELAFVLSEAPWWPEPYLEIARIEEKLGHLENAVVDLELYLVARPDAKDWKKVRARIRALRAEMLGPQ
jgi:hypothetical protein